MTARLNSNQARDVAYYLHPYTNLSIHEKEGPLVITRGEGIYVFDDAGNRYIEGLGGLWCASLGFNEERLVEAANRQMKKLPFYHSFGHKVSDVGIELAERLVGMAPVPMSKVFFTNSGSEANDTAVKLIWYYHNAIGKPEKKKIIARLKGYHGVTVAAASLTGLPNNHRDFDLPIARILHTDCPHHYRFARPGESEEAFAERCAQSLEALILKEGPETVAAFFAEPVMGAGGVITPPKGYFEKIQKVLKKYDVLFLADEVICGFGRTGNMFATTTYGLEPDMISIAKQLSAGYMPIAALMVNEKIYRGLVSESEKIGLFAHGFTYGGHPVPAAVALETLKIYEERQIVDHVRRMAPHFQGRLAALGKHPLVGEARGVGLIGGLELVKNKMSREAFQPGDGVGIYAARLAQANGVITRGMGDTLGFCPPLIITEGEIDALFDAVKKALDEAHAGLRKRQLVAA
ncbi:MAG TPA: aspartate aminotransferase family protein [Alphaproteobacteria bacterium]|nr:aspartate aminotransferase family protein [Alphaproteobacteria bacterium]